MARWDLSPFDCLAESISLILFLCSAICQILLLLNFYETSELRLPCQCFSELHKMLRTANPLHCLSLCLHLLQHLLLFPLPHWLLLFELPCRLLYCQIWPALLLPAKQQCSVSAAWCMKCMSKLLSRLCASNYYYLFAGKHSFIEDGAHAVSFGVSK